MTQRWRLVNGEELYDIQTDPGQKTDVASDHPDIVQKHFDDIAPRYVSTPGGYTRVTKVREALRIAREYPEGLPPRAEDRRY